MADFADTVLRFAACECRDMLRDEIRAHKA